MLLKRLKDALRRMTETAPAAPPLTGSNLHLQGQVEISATRVRLIRRNGNHEEIAWEDIDFITVDRYESPIPEGLLWVNFRSYRIAAACIPSTAEGFERVLEHLNTLAGVNTTLLKTIQATSEPIRNAVIWQKTAAEDFSLPDAAPAPAASLEHGIFLENLGQWLHWGTYAELGQHEFVRARPEAYPNPDFSGLRYVISHPIIANGLKLKQLYTLIDAARGKPNLDLPVLSYLSDISLGGNPVAAFSRIKSHLDRYFGLGHKHDAPDSENNDTLEAKWVNGRTTVTLRCFYREESQQWDKVAWLQLQHNPDVTRYYTSAYGNRLVLASHVKWQTFATTLNVAADYRQVSNALYTPGCFEGVFPENHDMLIWIDPTENIIGFANRQFALTFDRQKCTDLILVTRRFRGCVEGSALELHNGSTSTSLGGLSDAEEFERHEKAIAHLTGLKTGKSVYDEYY